MSKSKVTISDLIPQPATIEIEGKDPINIRAMNVDDWAWMQDKFGEKVEEKIKNLPVSQLMVILYRLMDVEGKQRFRPKEVITYDDDGEEITVRKTGPEMMAMAIPGMAGLQRATAAFQKSMGVGDRVAEILAVMDGSGAKTPVKKNRAERRATKQTGQKSMTSSPANTDIPLKSSAS